MDDLRQLILSSGKRDLVIDPPVMNASGMLGFADEARRHLDFTQLGAFITNTISFIARTPANPPRLVRYPGGFLLHTGHPNPGLSSAISIYRKAWREMPVPVIVNLLALSAEEARRMVQEFEGIENVMAIELLIRTEPLDETRTLVSAACSGELPVIARVPLTASIALVKLIQESGAHAVSLGPPRGSVSTPDGELVSGRLYGPSILAMGLETVQRLAPHFNLPLIGGCGISTRVELASAIQAGAAGVQLDYSLWKRQDQFLAIERTN